jgi:DNA-binding transcriptional LysR family regulator
VFEQNSRHRIEVVPVPAGFETPLDALEAGYADLALTSNAQPYRKGITTVMPLYPTVLPYTCCEGPPSTPGLWARPRGSCSRKSFTA